MWNAKILEANIFMIHKALMKFTKILFHKNLEPYGMRGAYLKRKLKYTESWSR